MTTLTSKGQVTIPKRLRDHLRLKPGAEVEFEVITDGRVVIVAKGNGPRGKSRFAKLVGSAKGKSSNMTTDQLMALTRGE
ncbi:MAG: AbrB/MazE/SpoVT family DNA-binding domain-containing protein [Alphaproteobacteria bacterium]|nr:AbrB/MazE/SpoVT family DNA-binding domain-containing protein [Alphaproteobacteria bacterium]